VHLNNILASNLLRLAKDDPHEILNDKMMKQNSAHLQQW